MWKSEIVMDGLNQKSSAGSVSFPYVGGTARHLGSVKKK